MYLTQARDRELAPDVGEAPRHELVILLPALDEAQAIGRVIDRVPRPHLRKRGYQVSVWVVDGQSSDATREIAMRKGAAIFVQRGKGKGTAMQQAFEYLARTDAAEDDLRAERGYYIMLDSDGTYPPEAIPRFLDALEAGHDIVLGSRFLGKIAEGAISPLNHIGNRLLNALAVSLYGGRVTDVCTGMWGLSDGFVRGLELGAHGFDLEADLFASARRQSARVTEVPIDYGKRLGQPKLVPLRTGLLIAWRLLKERVA